MAGFLDFLQGLGGSGGGGQAAAAPNVLGGQDIGQFKPLPTMPQQGFLSQLQQPGTMGGIGKAMQDAPDQAQGMDPQLQAHLQQLMQLHQQRQTQQQQMLG